MLMSQDAISSRAATRPRSGLSARAALQTRASVAAGRKRLRVNMVHLPALGNAPAGNTVEMVECFGAPLGNEFSTRRLDIAGLIGGAALQDGGAAVPAPRHTEPRERHGQYRML